eukprot:GSChrysophyteH2.ASY1.ANO1.959.1 assembled CDS
MEGEGSRTFFSRLSTFGVFGGWGWGGNTLTGQNGVDDGYAGMSFTRGITEALGLNYESDEAWTKSLIDAYVYGEEKSGREGDIPMPAGFGREKRFWRVTILSGVQGIIMGCMAIPFMNAADYVPEWWVNSGDVNNDFFDDASNCYYYKGKLWWILVPTLTGLVIGIIRWRAEYPYNLPGLFAEIRDYHVEPKWSPYTFILSAMSLAGGASLGPEQALSNLGGAMATYIAEHYPQDSMDSDDRKLLVLSGMSAALGSLFPTPLLGVLMIHEMGSPPRAYMESIIILSCGACVAFVVYYWLIDYTYVEHIQRQFFLTYSWTFELSQCGTAMLIGIVSGLISLTQVIIIGICKQIFTRIRLGLERNPFLQNVIPPIVGGAIVGLINYSLPLTVGGGGMVYKPFIPSGVPLPDVNNGTIDTNLLISTAFAKLFILGVSMNCGFVGGFVFPTILVGAIAAVVCFQWYPTIPLGMCVACFISAIPAGICPMPFTLAGVAIFTLYNGLYQTVPIYIATLMSYTVVCGSGVFTALQLGAIKRAEAQAAARAEAVRPAMQRTAASGDGRGNSNNNSNSNLSSDDDEKNFAINQYKGNKSTTRRHAAGAAN